SRECERAGSSGVAGRHDRRCLDHENNGLLGGACAVDHAFGDYEALLRRKRDRAALEIDDETTAEHEKEFVVVIVLMPMILALHDAEAYNGIVHLAERLIIPLFGAGLHERRHIDEFERIELNVEICRIRKGGASVRCRHRTLLLIGITLNWRGW